MPDSYLGMKIIPAMEAVLIEGLEPRQNRKRGDDLSAVEYIQKEDPEIQKKRVKQTVEAALDRASSSTSLFPRWVPAAAGGRTRHS